MKKDTLEILVPLLILGYILIFAAFTGIMTYQIQEKDAIIKELNKTSPYMLDIRNLPDGNFSIHNVTECNPSRFDGTRIYDGCINYREIVWRNTK